MQIRAYTVFDNKALIYNTPFFAATDGAALRSFEELANDLNTTVGRHPGDYSLWWCGTYDDQSGVFAAQVPLVRVADAVALVKLQPGLPLNGSGPGTDTAGVRPRTGYEKVADELYRQGKEAN